MSDDPVRRVDPGRSPGTGTWDGPAPVKRGPVSGGEEPALAAQAVPAVKASSGSPSMLVEGRPSTPTGTSPFSVMR